MISIRKNNSEYSIVQNNSYDVNLTWNMALSGYLIFNIICILLEEIAFIQYFLVFPIIIILINYTPKRIYLKLNKEKIEKIYSLQKKEFFLKEIEQLKINKKNPLRKGYNRYIYSLNFNGNKKNNSLLETVFLEELREFRNIILKEKN